MDRDTKPVLVSLRNVFIGDSTFINIIVQLVPTLFIIIYVILKLFLRLAIDAAPPCNFG